MAPVQQKRLLPSKIEKMKARKKRKIDDPAELPRSEEQSHKPKKKRKLKSLDDLPWTEVEAPDQLGDFEGFYGLEEVDNVEVIRDADGGVTYHALGGDDDAQGISAEVQTEGVSTASEQNGNHNADEDEWDGFEDEEAQSQIAKAQKQVPNKFDREASNHEESSDDDEGELPVSGTGFEVLRSHETDDEQDLSSWSPLELSKDTLASLGRLKFMQPMPIQSKAVPLVLQGHDLIGKAPTGSGKTLAFGIPILEHWLESASEDIRSQSQASRSLTALIVLPTRELAHQIGAHLKALFSNMDIMGPVVATLTGGLSVQKQKRILEKSDVVVATPGRLWQLISETVEVLPKLRNTHFLVIDEADRLLGDGHFNELSEVLAALDKEAPETVDSYEDEEAKSKKKAKPESKLSSKRQTLVFSATFASSLHRKLSNPKFSNNVLSNEDAMSQLLKKLNFKQGKPEFVDVNPITHLADNIREAVLECSAGTEKDLYLYSLLLLHGIGKRSLVFVNSISAVKRLVPFLQNLDIPALSLHSHMIQKARLRSVERFSGTTGSKTEKISKHPQTSVLVATDVAARGLDIPNIDTVVHYSLSRSADTYIHRSGRTARADKTGASILLCAPEEAAGVRRLVAQVHSQQKSGGQRQLRSVEMDRRVVSKLKQRVVLAKRLADAGLAKEKARAKDAWMEKAAEDLGGSPLGSDASEMEEDEDGLVPVRKSGSAGKGSKRKEREKEVRGMSKAEMRVTRAELRELLQERVNMGVSARYLTSGGIDVGKLLKEREQGGGGLFLGEVAGLGLD